MEHQPNREAVADSTYLIIGGGLAGGLIALALARAGRGQQVMLVEQAHQLGGNHTWSFHHTDLDDAGRSLVADLITRSWPRQSVKFPGHARTIEAGYSTITSEQFSRVLAAQLRAAGVRLLLGQPVVTVGASVICLDDDKKGETVLRGDLVLDARGPARQRGPDDDGPGARGGFQKFVGLELELTTDGPWTAPLLMDATVPQVDGYRFTYVLPYSSRHVLVEDTTYSRASALDVAACERGIHQYVARHGAGVARILRREIGVLPLPIAVAPPPTPLADNADAAGPVRVGYRGGFFHDVTGYSLPLAVRVARAVADAATPDDARRALRVLSDSLEPQRRFGRLLNRLMFDAMPAASRWTAFDRFYRLPEATIARFFASQTTWGDRARVLVGRPPAGMSWAGLMVGGRRGGCEPRADESRRGQA